LIGDLVQRAPEILDYVGGNGCQCVGQRVGFGDVVDALAALRIFFDGDSIRVGVLEGTPSKLKVNDVLFGPCDFSSNALYAITNGR
jgi:hypothetical protein